jgi:hypothetical protein
MIEFPMEENVKALHFLKLPITERRQTVSSKIPTAERERRDHPMAFAAAISPSTGSPHTTQCSPMHLEDIRQQSVSKLHIPSQSANKTEQVHTRSMAAFSPRRKKEVESEDDFCFVCWRAFSGRRPEASD